MHDSEDNEAVGDPVMGNEENNQQQKERLSADRSRGGGVDSLVSVESQREFDLFTGEWAHRVFVKLYVAARTSGLLSTISDRDWKTLCTLATYMDSEGYCFPSQAELATAMGCSRQMANERVRSLANFRFQDQPVLVIVKGKRGATGKWTGNGYRVLSLSSLRIYNTNEGPGTALISSNDSDIDSRPVTKGTVSSFLDTVNNSEPAMSSWTGTVALDTNKKQSSEQDLPFEFRRASYENLLNIEGAPDNKLVQDRPRQPEPTAQPGQLGHDEPQLLSEILHQRALSHPQVTDTVYPPPAGQNPPRPAASRRQRTQPDADPEAREQLRAFLTDFAVELGDEAPLASTITRTLNIFTAADVPPEQWGDVLYQARGLTQEHTAQIRKLATGDAPVRRKNKMPYFLATLEHLVGLRPDAPASAASPTDTRHIP